jgi:NAD-dependent histone deacetylase SIR2
MPSPNGRAQPEAGPSDEAEDIVNGTVTFRISKRELLSLQIRAFLDASDEVDLTAEVAEDLLQSMPSDDENEETEEEQDGQNEKEEDEDMDGIEITAKDGEISFSTVFNPNNAGMSQTLAQITS